MIHFRSAPYRTGISVADAELFFPPVDVRIYLHQMDRPSTFEGPQNRDGDTVIPSNSDRQCSGGEDFAYGRLCMMIMTVEIARLTRHVTTIDELDRFAVKRRSTKVEVPSLQPGANPI